MALPSGTARKSAIVRSAVKSTNPDDDTSPNLSMAGDSHRHILKFVEQDPKHTASLPKFLLFLIPFMMNLSELEYAPHHGRRGSIHGRSVWRC